MEQHHHPPTVTIMTAAGNGKPSHVAVIVSISLLIVLINVVSHAFVVEAARHLWPMLLAPFIAAAHQTISALCFLRYGLYPEAPSRRLYYATSIFGFLAVTLYTISIGIDFTLLFLEGETRERPVNKSVVCIGLLMAAFLGLPGNVVVVMRAWFLHPHAMGGGPHGQFHPDYIGRDPGAHRRRSTMTQSTMATSQGLRTLRPSEAVLQLPPMEMNLVNHKLAQRPSDSNLTTERENML